MKKNKAQTKPVENLICWSPQKAKIYKHVAWLQKAATFLPSKMLLCPVWCQWWTGLAIKIYRSYLEIPEPFHLHSNIPSWVTNELTAEAFILSHHQCPRQTQHEGHVLKFNWKMWWLSSTFLQIKCKFLLLIPFPLKDQVGQLALKLTLLPVVLEKLSWRLPLSSNLFIKGETLAHQLLSKT